MACLLVLAPVTSAASSAPAIEGSWGRAFAVPGLAALDVGANGQVNSVSCIAAGDCTAGGNYGAVGPHTDAFLAQERNGVWGDAIQVPGTSSFGSGANPAVTVVSCTAPGACTATGSYTNGSAQQDVFVVDEVHGVWGNAIEVPGITALATGGGAYVSSMSCAAPGDCAVGGQYVDGAHVGQAWIDGESDGVWGTAIEVPGTAALNVGGAGVNAVSCGAPGSCAAGGQYLDGSANTQVFVDQESWSAAEEVPGTASLNGGGNDSIYALSCTAAGSCTAGGYYSTAGFQRHAFVVQETNGTWDQATTIPGLAALDVDGYGSVNAISCTSAGNCTAVGTYEDASGYQQAFAATERAGVWHAATELPGSGALNAGHAAAATTVSCAAPGTCAVGGGYRDNSGQAQAFVDFEAGGTWRTALEVPGSGGLNTGGNAAVESVSCPTSGTCLAGGRYALLSGGHHGFLDAFMTPAPTISSLGPNAGPLRGGTTVVVHGTHLLGATSVMFGSKSARILGTPTDGTIRVVAPAGRGVVAVRVTTPGGTSALGSRDTYSYDAAPTVASLAPAEGPAGGGTLVTVHGSGLLGATEVRFGAARGTHLHVVNAHTLTVVSPSGRGTVSVTVATPGGVSPRGGAGRFTYT